MRPYRQKAFLSILRSFVASIDFVYPLSVHGQSSRKIGTSWGAPHTPDCTTIKEQNEERNQAKQI